MIHHVVMRNMRGIMSNLVYCEYLRILHLLLAFACLITVIIDYIRSTVMCYITQLWSNTVIISKMNIVMQFMRTYVRYIVSLTGR